MSLNNVLSSNGVIKPNHMANVNSNVFSNPHSHSNSNINNLSSYTNQSSVDVNKYNINSINVEKTSLELCLNILGIEHSKYESMSKHEFLYYYENFKDTTLLKVYGGEWKLTIMMDIEEQMSEEDYSIISYLDSNTLPQVILFSGIFKGNQKGIGWDLIAQDEDLSVFIAEKIKKKGKYEEVLGSGVIDIPTPKNLSKSEMDKYFKELFSNLEDSILEYMWIIEEFMNYKTNN